VFPAISPGSSMVLTNAFFLVNIPDYRGEQALCQGSCP
jgi:hypothetical protein